MMIVGCVVVVGHYDVVVCVLCIVSWNGKKNGRAKERK